MRTAGNARRNPLEAFVDRMLGIHGELGALRPTTLAPIAADLWLVLLGDLDVQPQARPEDAK